LVPNLNLKGASSTTALRIFPWLILQLEKIAHTQTAQAGREPVVAEFEF